MRLMKASLAVAAALFCTCAFAEVNINMADQRQLTEQLRNIGPGKAAAIIEYRERNGHFTDVGQLIEVNGIGDATLEMNRHLLTIGDSGGDSGNGGDGDGGHETPSASPSAPPPPQASSAARERLTDIGY